MSRQKLPGPIVTKRLHVPSIEVFKCIGGESSIAEYVKDTFAPDTQQRNISDWSGLYMQFDVAHALSTVGYRWDQGYQIARVLGATLHDVSVVLVDAEWMPDAGVSGEAKSAALREILGLDSTTLPLLEGLDLQRCVLVCRETQDQWELAIGPDLAKSSRFCDEKVEMELRPGPYGYTKSFRGKVDDSWQNADELQALPSVPPPEWITAALNTSEE